MAGKATSVYLTVSNRATHSTEFHRVFFTQQDLKKYVATDEFKAQWPTEQFYVTKETY